MFSTFPKTKFNFSSTFILSTANAFNLTQSKTLSCGKELMVNSLPDDKILDWSKLKEFADNNFKFHENGRNFFKWVENNAVKGEIVHNKQFLLFPQCFQKTCTANM